MRDLLRERKATSGDPSGRPSAHVGLANCASVQIAGASQTHSHTKHHSQRTAQHDDKNRLRNCSPQQAHSLPPVSSLPQQPYARHLHPARVPAHPATPSRPLPRALPRRPTYAGFTLLLPALPPSRLGRGNLSYPRSLALPLRRPAGVRGREIAWTASQRRALFATPPPRRDSSQHRPPSIPRAPSTTMDDPRPIANMGAPTGLSPSNTASDVPKEQSPGHPSFRRCVDVNDRYCDILLTAC